MISCRRQSFSCKDQRRVVGGKSRPWVIPAAIYCSSSYLHYSVPSLFDPFRFPCPSSSDFIGIGITSFVALCSLKCHPCSSHSVVPCTDARTLHGAGLPRSPPGVSVEAFQRLVAAPCDSICDVYCRTSRERCDPCRIALRWWSG